MTEKNLVFATDIQFLEPQLVENNPMLTKVKIRIAKEGKRNGFDISKEVLQEAAVESLALTPIVAFYNPFKDDFGEHGSQAVTDGNGEYVTTADTQAIGVIPENPIIYWDDEGYLTTFGYLWTTRYEETIKALEGRPQSMELSEADTIMQPSGGFMKVLKTAFKGLCVLGRDVPPAFEQASIEGITFSVINRDKLNQKKGEDEFMEKLQFALKHNFDDSSYEPPVIVDVDGEEKDKENREKVTEAIDELDDIANETTDPTVVEGIDIVLDNLVEAEVDMKKEAKIIPVTEEAIEGLKGEPTSDDGVVTSEILNYASKKKEEEEVATKKKKEVEQTETKVDGNVEVQQEDEKPAVVETETEEVKEEENPSDAGATEDTDGSKVGSEQEDSEPETVDNEEESINAQADEAGASVSQSNQGEAAVSISEQRESAGAKRASSLLGDVSNAELFEVLTTRISENNQEVISNLTQLLSNGIPSGLPEHNPDGVHTEVETTREDLGTGSVDDPSQISVEDPDNEIDDTNANMPSDKGNTEVSPEEASNVEVPAKEETDAAIAEDVETEEEVPVQEKEVEVKEEETSVEEAPTADEETEETEEEKAKKKKARFSLDETDLDVKSILRENLDLTDRVSALESQNKELLEFKLNIEKEEKESVLMQFNLTEEDQQAIRLEFAQLSTEEIEERAVIAEWKSAKSVYGQKPKTGQIQFSVSNEDIAPIESSEEDTLEKVLAAAQRKLKEADSKFF